MWQDPVIVETRILRNEYASQFNNDSKAIFEDIMAQQGKHPERVQSFPPRKPVITLIGNPNHALKRIGRDGS